MGQLVLESLLTTLGSVLLFRLWWRGGSHGRYTWYSTFWLLFGAVLILGPILIGAPLFVRLGLALGLSVLLFSFGGGGGSHGR